jgi:TRAP-type C4-dicarboxylate transport system substrate-binding protein
MFGRHKAVTISISAALIAATLTATGATAQLGKGGGAVPPVALELAVAEWAGSGLVDTFAAKVDELSGGQMRIDIDWDGGPEQVVPARVQDGEADLGWVFARGLNASGVHDLDALLTPFLVSDGSLLTAIITGQIGSDMLAGLADDGLEGLALLPGNQRFFVGIGHPLAAPADFDGARIALTGTPFTDRFVESLGAEPVEIDLNDRAAYEEQGIDGLLTVANNLGLFPDTYMTANLVPYTVPVIVLANAAVMAELTPEQQDVLRAAAIEVRDQMLDEMPSVESAAVRCGTGGAVIEASDADVLALEAGTRSVRDWLATDAATAGFIERIEALKAGSPPPAWPATCGTLPPVGTSLAGIPDGTYTTEVTEADAVRTGWEDICTLNGQVKTVTLVIEGERFTELQSCGDGPAEIGSEGTFEYAADRLVVREPGSSGGPTFAWSVDGETLSLQVVDPYDEGELGVLQFLFEHDFARTST